jgi:hypothetical protein
MNVTAKIKRSRRPNFVAANEYARRLTFVPSAAWSSVVSEIPRCTSARTFSAFRFMKELSCLYETYDPALKGRLTTNPLLFGCLIILWIYAIEIA